MNIGELFERGTVSGSGFSEQSAGNALSPHKTFPGVSLRHLVRSEMTGGQISCHLVKVEPSCVLDTHAHPEQIEIHQIIYGDGVCEIGDSTVPYGVGVVGVIPKGMAHRVMAGADGLYILAAFTPAFV
jgi:quercetin dioxygenase-like cupin family protein